MFSNADHYLWCFVDTIVVGYETLFVTPTHACVLPTVWHELSLGMDVLAHIAQHDYSSRVFRVAGCKGRGVSVTLCIPEAESDTRQVPICMSYVLGRRTRKSMRGFESN